MAPPKRKGKPVVSKEPEKLEGHVAQLELRLCATVKDLDSFYVVILDIGNSKINCQPVSGSSLADWTHKFEVGVTEEFLVSVYEDSCRFSVWKGQDESELSSAVEKGTAADAQFYIPLTRLFVGDGRTVRVKSCPEPMRPLFETFTLAVRPLSPTLSSELKKELNPLYIEIEKAENLPGAYEDVLLSREKDLADHYEVLDEYYDPVTIKFRVLENEFVSPQQKHKKNIDFAYGKVLMAGKMDNNSLFNLFSKSLITMELHDRDPKGAEKGAFVPHGEVAVSFGGLCHGMRSLSDMYPVTSARPVDVVDYKQHTRERASADGGRKYGNVSALELVGGDGLASFGPKSHVESYKTQLQIGAASYMGSGTVVKVKAQISLPLREIDIKDVEEEKTAVEAETDADVARVTRFWRAVVMLSPPGGPVQTALLRSIFTQNAMVSEVRDVVASMKADWASEDAARQEATGKKGKLAKGKSRDDSETVVDAERQTRRDKELEKARRSIAANIRKLELVKLRSSLSQKKLEGEERGDSGSDYVTGCHILDSQFSTIIVEGYEGSAFILQFIEKARTFQAQLAQRYERKIEEQRRFRLQEEEKESRGLGKAKEPDGFQMQHVVILFNEAVVFPARMYKDCPLCLRRLRVIKPIAEIAKDSGTWTLVSGLHGDCLRGIKRLQELRETEFLRQACERNSFPMPSELDAIEKALVASGVEAEDGATSSVRRIELAKVDDIAYDSKPSEMEESRSSKDDGIESEVLIFDEDKMVAKSKMQRDFYGSDMEYLKKRKEAMTLSLRHDFMGANVKNIAKISVPKPKPPPPPMPADGEVYNYSSQRLNYSEFQRNLIRQKVAADPGKHYTYNKEFLSLSFAPGDKDQLEKEELASSKKKWLDETGFTVPVFVEDNRQAHPAAPSGQRVEDLKEQWEPMKDTVFREGSRLPGDERPQFSTVPKVNPYFEKDPDFFKSVHVAGERGAKEREELRQKEKQDFLDKVVVDHLDFKAHYRGVTRGTGGERVGGMKVPDSTLDRLEPMLQGAPVKKALKSQKPVPHVVTSIFTAEKFLDPSEGSFEALVARNKELNLDKFVSEKDFKLYIAKKDTMLKRDPTSKPKAIKKKK